MSLIIQSEVDAFDVKNIKKSDFIRVKYKTWSSYINGIVAQVTENEIRAFYIADIGNVTNYVIIPINSVVNGDWEIVWSHDLNETYVEPEKEPDPEPDPEEGEGE